MKDDMLAIGKIHTFLKRVGFVAIKTVKRIMVLTLYYLNYGGALLNWSMTSHEKYLLMKRFTVKKCWAIYVGAWFVLIGTALIIFVNPVADFPSFSIILSCSARWALTWLWLFPQSVQCKCIISLTRDLWCCAEVNTRCFHHLSKDLASCRSPRPSAPPLWFLEWWGWIRSISTFLLFWLFPFSYSVVPGGQISGMPTQIHMVPTQNLNDVTACVSVLVYIGVCMNCLCIVCAGFHSNFMMMRVKFSAAFGTLSL